MIQRTSILCLDICNEVWSTTASLHVALKKTKKEILMSENHWLHCDSNIIQKQCWTTYIAQIWSIVSAIQVPIAVEADSEWISQSRSKDFNSFGCRDSIILFIILDICLKFRVGQIGHNSCCREVVLLLKLTARQLSWNATICVATKEAQCQKYSVQHY